MREYRLVLMVAVPAALTILGAIWALRRRADSDRKVAKKAKKETSDSVKRERKGEDRASQQEKKAVGGDKDGITITQRKIPESVARDRGDSDLIPSPDVRAGEKRDMTSGAGDLSATQREQVEALVSSALDRGIEEAVKSRLTSDMWTVGDSSWSSPQPSHPAKRASRQNNNLSPSKATDVSPGSVKVSSVQVVEKQMQMTSMSVQSAEAPSSSSSSMSPGSSSKTTRDLVQSPESETSDKTDTINSTEGTRDLSHREKSNPEPSSTKEGASTAETKAISNKDQSETWDSNSKAGDLEDSVPQPSIIEASTSCIPPSPTSKILPKT